MRVGVSEEDTCVYDAGGTPESRVTGRVIREVVSSNSITTRGPPTTSYTLFRVRPSDLTRGEEGKVRDPESEG